MKNLTRNTKLKRILVLEGGGETGVFQWGAMTELYNQGIDYSFFDYYVCTSSGAFNAAYFLTGQFEQGKENWLKNLPEMFWKPFRNDMQALERILRVIGPLDCEKLKQREQKIIIALGNIETKQTDYICLNDEDNVIKALLATCAMPLYSHPIELHKMLYYDGGLIGQSQIDEALSLAEKPEIWVIMMQPVGYRLSPLYWKLLSWLSLFNPKTRKLIVNYPRIRNHILDSIESNFNLKIIRPKDVLPAGYRSKDKKSIASCYELGKIQAKEFLIKNHVLPD